MKNKKSIAILMAAITLASCQSYKKYLIYKVTNHLQIRVIRKSSSMKSISRIPSTMRVSNLKDLLNITINTTNPQSCRTVQPDHADL